MLSLADGRGLDTLEWSSLFGSAPSTIHITPTNPHSSDVSTDDTIQLMNKHAINDSFHPVIQSAIEDIRDRASSDDQLDLVDATFDYVKDHVTFVEDEEITKRLFGIEGGVELLITPARLLSMHRPIGDCDDHSMLVKSLLEGMDIDTDFITVAADKSNTSKWSHVYAMAELDNGMDVPVDASHGKYLGWEAPNVTRKAVWKKKGEVRNMLMNGLGDGGGDYGGETSIPDPFVIPSSGGSSGGGGGFASSISTDWAKILSPFANASSQILKAQFGQPQLAPGTFIRGADGSILTNQPISGGIPNLATGGISSTMLLGIGAIVLAFAFLKR